MLEEHQHKQEQIVLQLNKSGLSYLTHNQFAQAFQYFKQSQKIIQKQLKFASNSVRINKLAGIVYNNLACYYKKNNKPKISLIYLQKALEIEVNRVEDWSATASTHLNICAIHSYLKDHQSAANHAQLALNMLQKLAQSELENAVEKTVQEERSIGNLHMLAHYNLAIQLDHLKRYELALEEFLKAKECAKKLGKKNTGIIMSCDESIERLRQMMNHLKNRLIQIVSKKRIQQEKGHYSSMRKNKKHLHVKRQSQGSLPKNIKSLKLYEEKPVTHNRTKTIFRMKTSPKLQEGGDTTTFNRHTSFTHN